MTPDDDTLAVLREIRDGQRTQLERQAEALALQREQFEIYKRQVASIDRMNERTAAFQSFGRRLMWILVPLFVLVSVITYWPYVVRLWP